MENFLNIHKNTDVVMDELVQDEQFKTGIQLILLYIKQRDQVHL